MVLRQNSRRVVLVADPIAGLPDSHAGEFNRDIDRPWSATIEQIHTGLASVCGADHVITYNSVSDFIDNARDHRDDIVFPYWFGQRSRSRHGLLPAVCEAYGIAFVGADAFTKIVCNDKLLSKSIIRDAGLQAPEALQLHAEQDLERLGLIRYPAVVKPNFEGTSLGIADKNLVDSAHGAEVVARELMKSLRQPILVEEFIEGRELSICLLGDHESMRVVEAMAWEINGDPAFLDKRLFTYDLKIDENLRAEPRYVTGDIDSGTMAAAVKVFRSFDKVDAMRIDGRLGPSGFSVIELTPDLYLGPDGELSAAAAARGFSYTDVLEFLLDSALKGRT